MRVICVDGIKKGEKAWDTPKVCDDFDAIYEGEIYNVVREKVYDGHLCYFLQEKRNNAAYYSGLFMPLSEIDEKELVKERELVNA
jgi:hypothetical protein